MKLTATEQEVLKVIHQRQIKGRKTYGKGINSNQNNIKGWVDEAIEEAADLLQYLVALKCSLKNIPTTSEQPTTKS